jgi:DNA-directed RNA polymerase I, II, and III subunit RPABC3
MDLLIDIANDIYPLHSDDRFHCVLSHSLTASSSSAVEEGFYDPELISQQSRSHYSGGSNLADKFDYVMYGKIYKAEEAGTTKVAVYVSFGGLLMVLEGDPRHWRDIKVGSSIYILLKKI